MGWDRPPNLSLFGEPIEAIDLYAEGTECHAVPIAFIPILLGALNELRSPDAWYGSDSEVALVLQQIGHFIGLYGTKFTLCECPEGENGDQPTYPIGFESLDNGDCDMSGCSIPYGALRWNNGALEYLYCGVWYPVEGQITTQPDPDDDIITPPPDGVDESTACAKAYKAATYLYNLAVVAVSEADASTDVWDFYSDVTDQFPRVDFAYNDMARAWVAGVGIDLAGAQGEATEIGVIDYLACYWSPFLTEDQGGITQGQYASMRDSLKEALTKYYSDSGAENWAVWGNLVLNFYWWLFQAVGAGDWKKITYGALPTPGQDCTCPDETAFIYNGPITFNGTYTQVTKTPSVIIEGAYRYTGNKAVVIQMASAPNTASQEIVYSYGLDGANVGDLITFRMYPASGVDINTTNWQTFDPVTDSSLWAAPILNIETSITFTRTNGAGYFTWQMDTNTNTNNIVSVKLGGKMSPQAGIAAGQRYFLVCEIVAINGVAYPTKNYVWTDEKTSFFP